MLLAIGSTFTACKDDEGSIPHGNRNLLQVAESQTELNYFLAVVERAGFTNTFTDGSRELTVFAPNNKAFEKYIVQTGLQLDDIPQEELRKALENHMVEGRIKANALEDGTITSIGGQSIRVKASQAITLNDNANITASDLEASNGVIHIIDDIIQESAAPEGPTSSLATSLGQEEDLSILAGILSLPQFNDLAAEMHNPEATLTIFAPTNQYFLNLMESLGKSSVEELPNAVLNNVIRHHILGASYASTNFESKAYTSLYGETLNLNRGNTLSVDNIAIAKADLQASNGYIHKIAGVLLPAEAKAARGTVLGLAYFDADFTMLIQALREAELMGPMLDKGPFTLLAPNNQAFENSGIHELSEMPQEDLQKILLYHVINGKKPASQLEAGALSTLGEKDTYISLKEDRIYINGNTALSLTDLDASNGIMHVTDHVLMPPTKSLAEIGTEMAAAENPEFSLFLKAIERAGLLDDITDSQEIHTVFAPTDEAFIAAGYDAEEIDNTDPGTLEVIMLYHVIKGRLFSPDFSDGDIPTLQGESIGMDATGFTLRDQEGNTTNINRNTLNILATNGVIHAIDAVLITSE